MSEPGTPSPRAGLEVPEARNAVPPSARGGDTFSTITASVNQLKEKDFETFFKWIYGELIEIKLDRERFYLNLRKQKWRLMSRLRGALVGLAIVALLATVVATAAPLIADEGWRPIDRWALLVALVAYALMGAIGIYQRGTSITASYFRQVTAALSIRNQWNRLQISLLKELPALLADPDGAKSRARVCELAENFCNEIDKLVTTERESWEADFVKSIQELDKTSEAGLADAKSQMAALTETVRKATEEAGKAAATFEAASKPAHINLKIDGQFDGEVTVFVDDDEFAKEASAKFVLANLRPGHRKLTLVATKDDKPLRVSEMKNLTAGLNDVQMSFS